MSSRNELPPQDQVTLTIKCHWCGHTGLTLWEKTDVGLQFVSIDGFYEHIVNKRPFRMETICNTCNRPQPV